MAQKFYEKKINTMIALKFYFPSRFNGDDQCSFMKDLWDQGIMSYLIFTRRMSLRGNPYIKGVFILDDDNTTVPTELECTPVPQGFISLAVSEFKEELLIEDNGVELGSLY